MELAQRIRNDPWDCSGDLLKSARFKAGQVSRHLKDTDYTLPACPPLNKRVVCKRKQQKPIQRDANRENLLQAGLDHPIDAHAEEVFRQRIDVINANVENNLNGEINIADEAEEGVDAEGQNENEEMNITGASYDEPTGGNDDLANGLDNEANEALNDALEVVQRLAS